MRTSVVVAAAVAACSLGLGTVPAHATGSSAGGAARVAASAAPAFDDYQRATLRRHARYLVQDIKTADLWTADGIQAELALAELGNTFDRLLGDAVPPGSAATKYRARLAALRKSALAAADAYERGADTVGLATYTVVRRNTPPILTAINRALGTHYRI